MIFYFWIFFSTRFFGVNKSLARPRRPKEN
nr:MAG TPA: hypothetical protein [Caudoviricetes sp.]